MPDYVIKTQFRGADKISPLLKKMGIRVKRVGDDATRSFRRASKQTKVFGGVLKGILAAGVIRRGFTAASMAVRGLAEEFVDFDVNITKAVTRLPGQLDRTSKEFAQLSQAARVEAAKTEFTAGQTAAAVEQLALAGFEAKDVLSLLPGVLQLATNAGIEVADATRMATKSMGAFGLRTGTTAEKQKNLTRVNDVFSRAVSSASLNIEDLFETLKFAGPAMFGAGQDIETFSAATELLADRAIDASIAGTSLRTIFLNLAAPVPKAKKLLRDLKIEVQDSDKNFRPFADILADVGEATQNMGNVQRTAALKTIFGKRAINAMNILVDEGSDKLKTYEDRLRKAGGASKTMAETIRTSIGVRLKILRSALIELGFKFVTAFTGKAGKGLDDLVAKVRKFDMKPVVQGVKDAVKWTKDFWNAIKPFADFLPVVITLWAGYKAVMLATIAVHAAKFFIDLGGAIKLSTISLSGLKAAFLATTVSAGVIAFALVGLVAALAIVIAKNDDVVAGWEVGFARMHQTLIRYKVNALRIVQTLINGIIDAFTALPAFVLKIFGIDVEPIIPKIQFDFSEEERNLAQIEKRIVDMKAEAAGLGVARGAAGIRGGRIPQAQDPRAALTAKQFAIGQGRQIAQQAVSQLFQEQVQAPNRSEVEAQRLFFEGRMSFENAPAGARFEGKTTGNKPVAVEGLGPQ